MTYPKNYRELGWSHGGGIVALTLEEKEVNNGRCLYFLIKNLILEESHKNNVSFISFTKVKKF